MLTETLVSMEEQRTAQEQELIDQMKGTMKDRSSTSCEDHLDRGVTKIERTLDNNVGPVLRSRWKRKWLSFEKKTD